MLRFLDDDSILEAVNGLLSNASSVKLAVAYWGHGAIRKLAIDPSKPTEILCDLLSGGCNPTEIEKLIGDFAALEIRHSPRLHSKVYWSPERVIVGSANASNNGLGDEDDAGTVDAAMETDEGAALDDAKEWFGKKWKAAKTITPSMLEQAYRNWLRKRPIADPKSTVLQTLREDAEWFHERVWVVCYNSAASAAAEAKFERVKAQYYSPHELTKISDQNLPLYDIEIADIPKDIKGQVVLDMSDKLIYEVIETQPYSKKRCILLLKKTPSVFDLRFPASERSDMRKAVTAYMRANDLDDFSCRLQELGDFLDLKQLVSLRDAGQDSL